MVSKLISTSPGDIVSRPKGSKLDILASPDGTKRGICNVVSLLPFTYTHDGAQDDTLMRYILPWIWTSYLAIKHLNEGDGSLVKELKGLNETCNIQFELEHIDITLDPITTGQRLIERLENENESPSTITDSDAFQFNPCTFVDSYFVGHPTILGAYIIDLYGYTEVSGGAMASELSMNSRFFRTIPASGGPAEALVQYLVKNLETKYLVVLRTGLPDARSFTDAIHDFANKLEDTESFQIEEVIIKESGSNVRQVIRKIKALNFRTILVVVNSSFDVSNIVMEEAFKQGIAGDGEHIWLFSDSTFNSLGRFERESSLDLAYRGAGIFFTGYPSRLEKSASPNIIDHFAMLMDSSNDVQNINSTLPDLPYNSSLAEIFTEESLFLISLFRSAYEFHYDAVVSSGLAACRAASSDLFLDADNFYKEATEFSFDGLSGKIEFDPSTGSRLPNSTSYNFVNLGAVIVDDEATNEGHVNLTYSALFTNGTWKDIQPFVYNDGTNVVPPEIKVINLEESELTLSPVTSVICWTLCIIPVILGLAGIVWTTVKRKTRIVRASQPFFLNLICVGTIILSLSTTTTLPFDYEKSSQEALNAGCNAQLWFLFLGISTILSAFFSKTHRILQIMKASKQYKKVKITVRDALIPMVITMTYNIIVLSLMTALSPFEYETTYFGPTDRYGRQKQLYGACSYRGNMLFWIFMGLFNIGLLILCAFEAYKARTLATEFQETEHILKAVVLGGGVFFIGVPVIFLNRENKDVSAFILNALIFSISMIVLCLMFVPKIRHRDSKQSVVVSGVNVERGSSGAVIITNKTRKELVKENAMLRQRLRSLDPEAKELQEDKVEKDNGN